MPLGNFSTFVDRCLHNSSILKVAKISHNARPLVNPELGSSTASAVCWVLISTCAAEEIYGYNFQLDDNEHIILSESTVTFDRFNGEILKGIPYCFEQLRPDGKDASHLKRHLAIVSPLMDLPSDLVNHILATPNSSVGSESISRDAQDQFEDEELGPPVGLIENSPLKGFNKWLRLAVQWPEGIRDLTKSITQDASFITLRVPRTPQAKTQASLESLLAAVFPEFNNIAILDKVIQDLAKSKCEDGDEC
ncbi:hypothetical protein EDC01DRAFT_636998 [Geopyxis carbonaria]|nr:hypothetical protein EDC01DRAFT_636998 [Geopyxis carbonaria]